LSRAPCLFRVRRRRIRAKNEKLSCLIRQHQCADRFLAVCYIYVYIYIYIVIRCYCNITRIVYIIIMHIIIICINDCAAKCVFIAADSAGSEQNAFVANAHLTYSYINIVVHCIVFGKSGNTFMYSVLTRIPVLDNMLMCNTQYIILYIYIFITTKYALKVMQLCELHLHARRLLRSSVRDHDFLFFTF
jgi:hypothetical protein